jgi:hypothetical protein
LLIIFFRAFIKFLMPTQKPIIPVAMDEDMVKRIDDYRRTIKGSIPSWSEAIRCLIEEGLKASDPSKQK